MSKSTPAGLAGNVSRDHTPLRDWSAPSYDPRTGRAVSSLSPDQLGQSPVGSVVGRGNAQIPDVFAACDKRRTQIATPVKTRRFSQSR